MVIEELCEQVVKIRRVMDSDRSCVIFDENELRLICGQALQSGGCLEEKQSFYDELKSVWYALCR